MIDVIRWLLVSEALLLLFLPLTVWAFGALTDRGFAFGKILALILVVWLSWWIGFPTGVGGSAVLIAAIAVGGGIVSWIVLGRRAVVSLEGLTKVIAVEESLFVAAFVVWAVVRSFNPDILGTEKPMDMMFLQATSHVGISPPSDLWLAGHSANYYYFGYLLMATMGKLAGSAVATTYNLALAFIFALAITGSFSLVFNLTRSRVWASVGPILIVLSGNAFALFTQVLHGQYPWNHGLWYWWSSRVVANGNTINEFPMFSFVLGDLHPHVMSIPITLACVGASLALFSTDGTQPMWSASGIGRLAVFGVLIGSLFATNTWDYPTYTLLAVASLTMVTFRVRSRVGSAAWLGEALAAVGLLVSMSLLAFIPFYIQYHSPTSGIGLVSSTTNLGQFAQVFGLFGVLAAGFLVMAAARSGCFAAMKRVVQPRLKAASAGRADSYGVLVASSWLAVILVLAVLHRWVLILIVGTLALAGWALFRRHVSARQSPGKEQDGSVDFALVLLGLAALVVGITELVYLRDGFAGGTLYRMNTVFKFYYQAWIILGVVAAFAIWRVARWVWPKAPVGNEATEPGGRQPSSRRSTNLVVSGAWGVISAAVIAVGLVYTVLGPISYYGSGQVSGFAEQGLNGMKGLASTDPEDYLAIEWINSHVRGTPTVLEATGNAYTLFGRVSVFTGLPTLLGWQDHENQWRGTDPAIAQEHSIVDQIYSTGNVQQAKNLIAQSGVQLVYVGPCEQYVYSFGPPICDSSLTPTPRVPSARTALTKFRTFMTTVYSADGVSIYQVPGSSAVASG